MSLRYKSVPLLFMMAWFAAAAVGQEWNLPRSTTGQALEALLDVVAGGDEAEIESFVRTHMDEQFQRGFSMNDHIAFFRQLHSDLHPFEIASLKKTGEFSAEVVLAARRSPNRVKIRFGLSERPPHPFNDLDVQPMSGPEVTFSSVAELDKYLSERENQGTFSGVVLIGRGGDVEFLKAYGRASKRYDVPNRSDTRFNIGSINKLFTGVAALQLAEQGLVDLDAPIGAYVDGFPSDVARTVTVRHLLQHRSGWESYFDKVFYRDNWPRLRSVDDYIEFIRDIPLEFEPGTSRQYSNVGYVVLGAIIETVTGADYYTYVSEHIFDAAGMKDTDSYEVDRPVPNLAIGYVTDDPETPFNRENTFLHSARGTPAGGGYSTAEDLYRFDRALRSHELLAAPYTNLLFRGFEGEPEKGDLNGGVGYAGGGPGINAVLEMDFASDATVVILSNYDPPIAEELGQPVMQMVLGSP